ncbi:MAG: GNAT family N-acetyltransferase [Pedobacter sp.]
MKENITTRHATKDDLPKLDTFLQMLVEAERPFDPTLKDGDIFYYDLKTLIAEDSTAVMIVEANGGIIGSGYAQIRSAKSYERHNFFGYIGFMLVIPEFRGKGIYRVLINELKQWILSKGITEVRLEVYHENDAAVSAYEKVGFKKFITTMRFDMS